MKQCRMCRKELEEDQFAPVRGGGRRTVCRVCSAALIIEGKRKAKSVRKAEEIARKLKSHAASPWYVKAALWLNGRLA